MIARILLALCLVSAVGFASSDSDWAAIVAMDAGPKRKPVTREDFQMIARSHLAAQKALIEDFLTKYPADPHAFDAKQKLASILATQGNMDNTTRPVSEALAILGKLENDPEAPAAKRADVGFRRISLYLQSMRGREVEMREAIVDAARGFVSRYPGDKRGPRLLVEVSTICDGDPKLKRQLLEQARGLSKEDALNRRIADDLVRIGLLDKPLDLKFKTIQGGTFSTADEKGNVVVLLFWSAESPQCLLWLKKFSRDTALLPKANLRIATVSLDSKRSEVTRRMTEFAMDAWPTSYEGAGWESSVARPLGINALPTVFILDKSGALRALNAQDNYIAWVQKLLRQPL